MSSAKNPFQWMYEEAARGNNASKYAELPEYPTHIDVELTSTCNFRCRMCPVGNLSLDRPAGFMSWETFDRIVEQCASQVIGLRFVGWGEPMMHPQVFRFLRRATDALLPTHLNTNGSKIGDYEQQMLINMGLDSIKFSLQGSTRETYAEMRSIDFYDDLFNAVRKFHRRRGVHPKPFISVSTTVTDEHPSTIEVFKRKFSPFCDQLSVGHTTFDFMDDVPEDLAARQTVEKKHFNPCPEVFDKLAISFDGTARVCCNDYNGTTNLGNINQFDLKDIWKEMTIVSYRKRLSEEDYTMPLCNSCFDYMKLTDG